MVWLQELITIIGYTSPLWLYGLYIGAVLKHRSIKGFWLRPEIVAIPVAALVIAVTRFHNRGDLYDWRLDLGRGVLSYCIALIIGRTFERTTALKKDPIKLEFIDAE